MGGLGQKEQGDSLASCYSNSLLSGPPERLVETVASGSKSCGDINLHQERKEKSLSNASLSSAVSLYITLPFPIQEVRRAKADTLP